MAPISPGDFWGAEKPWAHLLGCGVLAVHGGRWQTALGCCSQPPTLRAERERGFGDHQPLGELQGREDPCCWEGSYGCKVPGGGQHRTLWGALGRAAGFRLRLLLLAPSSSPAAGS